MVERFATQVQSLAIFLSPFVNLKRNGESTQPLDWGGVGVGAVGVGAVGVGAIGVGAVGVGAVGVGK